MVLLAVAVSASKIANLHEIYRTTPYDIKMLNMPISLSDAGLIIRVTPDEIHRSDPDNYEMISHVGSRVPKVPEVPTLL